jgi:hypothetical protein
VGGLGAISNPLTPLPVTRRRALHGGLLSGDVSRPAAAFGIAAAVAVVALGGGSGACMSGGRETNCAEMRRRGPQRRLLDERAKRRRCADPFRARRPAPHHVLRAWSPSRWRQLFMARDLKPAFALAAMRTT